PTELRVGLRLRLLRFDGARSRAANGAAGKRQQRDVARALDGYAEPALMTGANAGHAARQDLAALLHQLRKNAGALVVDQIHLLERELAGFLLAEELALAARASAGATWTAGTTLATTAARAAFATRTSGMATFVARSLLRSRLRSGRLRWRRCRR